MGKLTFSNYNFTCHMSKAEQTFVYQSGMTEGKEMCGWVLFSTHPVEQQVAVF